MQYDWTDLAFGSKKPLTDLSAIFIAAPRELSQARFKQLVKTYLPRANIILGLAKEPYVLGLEDQPQFKTLQLEAIGPIISKVNATKPKHTITTLNYFQRDLKFILEKLNLQRVVLVNGSWKHLFHTQPPYYALATRRIPYDHVSPFTDEAEAQAFEHLAELPALPQLSDERLYSEAEMLELANLAATHSFDNGFQTGVALGLKQGSEYRLKEIAFNRVLPYQTYAWHHGATRELNFSPMNDLNHYDTNHAEVELVAKAVSTGLDLRGTTVFINLLPCPTCARMFTAMPIAEVVYREDHSAGYAIKMLEQAGKTVRRLV
jgi:deoxycytidylate deaminase